MYPFLPICHLDHFTLLDIRSCEEHVQVNEFFRPEHYDKPFPRQVVKLKYFDEDFVEESLGEVEPPVTIPKPFELVDGTGTNYKSRRMRDRVGQVAFRQRVLAAYSYRCCVTGESTIEILEAAHIQPYINRESNHIQNGLALRADFHRLFDAGPITVEDDYHLVTSNRLKSMEYATYHGREVLVPGEDFRKPSREALEIHRAIVFRD